MKIRPRPYQTEAVQSVYDYFTHNTGNPLILMPTGTGKAVVIAMFLESVFRQYPGQRIMVLTHVKELIEQNYLKLLSLWPQAPAGVYSAGLNRRDYLNSIVFAGIASVAKRAQLFGRIDLVIIDEAHLVSPNDETMYRAFLNDLLAVNPHLKVIGLTATGWRLGHGKITDPVVNAKGEETPGIFTDVCYDITGLHAFNRLIAEGYLCPLVPKRTSAMLDVDGVHMRGGEFIASELQVAVDKAEVTYAALKETMELGANRHHWLIFASGVQHAEHVQQMLESLGVPTVVIHGKMSMKERDAAIAGFKAGKYRAAVNNNVLTTGFDFPAIDLIVVLRPTASPVLWVQMLGRGTRPFYCDGFDLDTIEGRLVAIANSQKQNCLVLDFAGNTRRLGPINDPVVPRRKGQKGGEAPVKLCECCGTYNHASVTHCFSCGAEFRFTVKIKQQAATEELIKEDSPIVEVFKVDHITYTKHKKLGKGPMMKVSYYCGLRMFEEFVCVQHEGFARRKAEKWWKERRGEKLQYTPLPALTAEALELAEHLQAATHLRVWTNKKYPEILACCFDGTAFGEQQPSAAPTVQAFSSRGAATPGPVLQEDDIPF